MTGKHIPAIVCAVVLLGAAPCGGRDGVIDAYSKWTAAYANHDLAGTMAFFDPSVVMSFAGTPDARYAQLRKGYAREYAHPSPDRWIPTFEAPMVDDITAVATSRWRLVRGSKDVIHNRGVDVLRCEAGSWRVVRSLNYTEWQAKNP
jgi:hypothetical protein